MLVLVHKIYLFIYEICYIQLVIYEICYCETHSLYSKSHYAKHSGKYQFISNLNTFFALLIPNPHKYINDRLSDMTQHIIKRIKRDGCVEQGGDSVGQRMHARGFKVTCSVKKTYLIVVFQTENVNLSTHSLMTRYFCYFFWGGRGGCSNAIWFIQIQG